MSLPGREKLSQAYEFAIDKIGMDYNSYTLWNDYANLLKNAEVVGSYAENQKIMAVRKVNYSIYYRQRHVEIERTNY